MRYYESLYIVNPNYEQDRLDEVMKMVVDKMDEYGFSVINHRVWGKKRLAYSIQKHKYGSFILLQYEAELAENLDRFERFMVLQKPILRNQTVVLDARPEVHVEEEPVSEEKKDNEDPSEDKPQEEAVAESAETTEESVEDTAETEETEATSDEAPSEESQVDDSETDEAEPAEEAEVEATEEQTEEVQE